MLMIVDVCGISSLDPATWDAWVAVIVPAYGLGYVSKEVVRNVLAHPPSTKSTSGLHLTPLRRQDQNASRVSPIVVLQILEPLGHMLKYLRMDAYHAVSTAFVHEIVRLCPSLQVLIVRHSGAFWSHQGADTNAKPCDLKELELNAGSRAMVEPSPEVLRTFLPHLTALRIRTHERFSDQLKTHGVILRHVLQYVPLLWYLHWVEAHVRIPIRRASRRPPRKNSCSLD